ncbi:phage major capsid protein [Microbacterium aerolatum]|uniref:phage major capsid protein n=1 Tax=Microbacterium aerolatum TaxID=153731 RepID=UPI002000A681|nr:phage major capsid protein [Microbacterium aerolatum]MCK3768561.1 phage major capsid protein [Microbacterium aerolatum]
MAISTTTAAELTAEQVQSILVKPLEQQSVFLAAGPRIFDTDGSPVRIPKLGSATSPDWYGENELIADEDVDFDEVTLLPSTIKSVKTLTRFSNELARQSVVSLDAAIKDRLVKDVADKLDTAFIAGTGDTGTTPTGILNYAGAQEVDEVGAIGLDAILDAWGLLLAANANIASTKWLMRPETFVALRKIKSGTDSNGYVLTPDPTQDGVFRLFGSQVIITNRIPVAADETSAVLADFSQIAVARDQAPTVKILDQTFGDYDQQAIRVTARYDAAPLNPEAVVVLKGITA